MVTRDITPGHHQLRCHNTLVWKTVEFDVAPGDHVRFSIVNYKGGGFLALMAVVGVAVLYLDVERDDEPTSTSATA